MIILKAFSIIIFLMASLIADIKVVNSSVGKSSYIKTLKGEKKSFVSTRDFVSSLSSRRMAYIANRKPTNWTGRRCRSGLAEITQGNSSYWPPLNISSILARKLAGKPELVILGPG